MPIVLFLLGLILLLIGAWGVVCTALQIATKARISPLIIGITAVAIGTSLPELTVSVLGGFDHASHLALGNIIGSNIVNIGLIFGFTTLFSKTYVGTSKTQSNVHLYILFTIVASYVLITNNLTWKIGVVSIGIGFMVLCWQINQGTKNLSPEEKKYIKTSKKTYATLILLLLFVSSLISLITGGKFIVDYGVILAQELHISETIIGITAVALGTSLPELAVSITGLFKRQPKLVVGNILGSNIYNILFGGGILGLYNVDNLGSNITIVFFIIFSLLFSWTLYFYRGKIIPRMLGLVFLTLHVIYLVLLFTH